jgi:competence protein ComEA
VEEGRYYATAIVIGVMLVCMVVLGARWRVVSQRVPLVHPAAAEAGAVIHAGAAAAADNASPAAGAVDINTAGAVELEALPGIGPVLAGRIVAYREAHGPFGSLRELLRVSGIGEKKLAGLAGQAVCSGGD